MRVGAFDLNEPLPELNQPHALAMLRPWIDVGSVGTMVLSRLEAQFGAKEIGRLAKPGVFFDFTRYRPVIYNTIERRRQVAIPNTVVTYARCPEHDLVLLHLLEPHMFGETFVNSVVTLLKQLGVVRYCLLGSMYDMVPHTRQLVVTGGGTGKAEDELSRAGIEPSDYQGPTTITHLISQKGIELGMETMTLIVHLPQYTELEEDASGMLRILEVLDGIYGAQVSSADTELAQLQQRQIDATVMQDKRLKRIVAQLESHYDTRAELLKQEKAPSLSPEIEKFLREMEQRFS